MNESQKKLLDIIKNFVEKEIEQVITFAEFLVYQKNKVISRNRVALKELAKL